MNIVAKLRVLFLILVLTPCVVVGTLVDHSALLHVQQFSRTAAIFLGISLLLALLLPNVAAGWLIEKKLEEMRQLCSHVKQGNFKELCSVPNEGNEGDEDNKVVFLMRDMNWMARHIEKREKDLHRAVEELSESRQQVNRQNAYLRKSNEKLLLTQKRLRQQAAELEHACRQLKTMAMTDPLTSLANRRYFFTMLEKKYNELPYSLEPLSLIMIDIDRFKVINDTYGHQAGDKVLIGLAQLIQEHVRVQEDLPARVGGEEYAVLLGNADLQEAMAIAARIHSALEQTEFAVNGQCIQVRVSIGICTISEMSSIGIDEFYSCADQALYYSKNNGRNLISVCDSYTKCVRPAFHN
jgi:diguanylate cyclase (GGDEF)-like protein